MGISTGVERLDKRQNYLHRQIKRQNRDVLSEQRKTVRAIENMTSSLQIYTINMNAVATQLLELYAISSPITASTNPSI
jgi:hypothetical protein